MKLEDDDDDDCGSATSVAQREVRTRSRKRKERARCTLKTARNSDQDRRFLERCSIVGSIQWDDQGK
ncbi:hypothetical protein PIB30_067218 [Stylosanthes scabra]|uniref:Uncharacterized protein n=1 Tax=Stylosanthes scabra TaxID=79078 RepID=A0ABU6QNB4_9FABA|nr:hypothetical protein [Stylosanthes scabra]